MNKKCVCSSCKLLKQIWREESAWRVTELLCSLAASTPLLILVRKQKSCFSAWQDAGMESRACPSCRALEQAAGFSQHVPCSCVCQGQHSPPAQPQQGGSCREQGASSGAGSTCLWSAKEQSRDQHLAQSLLHCAAIFPLFLKSAFNEFKNNYWKEQNRVLNSSCQHSWTLEKTECPWMAIEDDWDYSLAAHPFLDAELRP